MDCQRRSGGLAIRAIRIMIGCLALHAATAGSQTTGQFVPVTDDMLKNPDPADWLMYSRTYDAQRFSPLDQIDRGNVADLEPAWTIPLPAGLMEGVPIVHDGIMYIAVPAGGGEGGGVMALDAATGETIWHYQPDEPLSSRIKALSIYGDMVYFTAPASGDDPEPVVALDAVTGAVKWQTPVSPENHTSGSIVADGKVISGRTCNSVRENCYIAAHDAKTGKEVWRFYTAPGAGDPRDDSWAGAPASGRRASTWGLPGTYDAARNLVFWGISNPMPNTRADRHGGDPGAIPDHAPADLYSDSTVALDADTGQLVWYYQHLPGDDWDMDVNHEKILIHTVVDPHADAVKWINPNIPKREARDLVVTSGEAGGIWVNDRATGEFVWAMPFPYDTPYFVLSDIDVETGITKINWDDVLTEPGANRTICYWNTRSYWPTSYDPETNSLYVPYFDYCLSMTRATPDGGRERRTGLRRPGSDPEKFAGIGKIDMTTGEITRIHEGRAGGFGAMLTTAGGLLFWGDMMHVLHAFDAATGDELWRSGTLSAPIMSSTITYAVDGRQYVAVVNANYTLGARTLAQLGGVEPPEIQGNALTVFALPN